MKTLVSVEEVMELKARLAEINKLSFKDIIWTEKGMPLLISDEVSKDWKFVGLCNSDFVFYGFHKKKTLWADK